MDIEEFLGIDGGSPLDERARRLVEGDDKLLDDLVAMRKRRPGLTQRKVASKMGVSQSAVARIESGERDPHMSTLRRYAMAIGAIIEHEVIDDLAPRSKVHIFYGGEPLPVDESDPIEALQLAQHAWVRQGTVDV